MSNLVIDDRLKKLKQSAALALVMALAGLTLTGCAGTGRLVAGSGINSPVVMKYTINNPLNIEDVKEGNGTEADYHYIKVSGLRDEEIEKKINDRIKAVYDGLRVQDLPPYRGIKERIPEGFILRNDSIYVNVSGNFNNILSVVFNKYASYQDPGSMEYEKDPKYYDSTRYFSEIETLNFDLCTGEEFKLRDVFCDDADYMVLINDRVSRFLASNYADDEGYYVGSYGEIKQVESFKGLSEDQMFAVYPYGIAFVFDYRTPQFETGGIAVSPVLYYAEFGDSIALTERFYREDENLYLSEEPPVKSFAAKYVLNDIVGNNYTDGTPINIFQSWSYSSQLPEEIKAKLEKMREVNASEVEKMKDFCSRLPGGPEENQNTGAYEVMVSGEKIGPFYNIRRNTNIYLPNSSEMSAEYHCYDGETLKELKLEDIFNKDIDYRSVLEQAIKKAVREAGYTEAQGGAELTDEYYAKALSGISGFNLQTDSLLLAVESPEEPNHTGSINLYIPYADIGCYNLTIFDE